MRKKKADDQATGKSGKVDPQVDHAKKKVDLQATGKREEVDTQSDHAKKKANDQPIKTKLNT